MKVVTSAEYGNFLRPVVLINRTVVDGGLKGAIGERIFNRHAINRLTMHQVFG